MIVGSERNKSAGDQPAVNLPLDTAGIYSAVLVATFGGVQLAGGQGREPFVHPIFLLLLCVPIFVMQAFAILCLRNDLDIDVKVYDPQSEHSNMVLTLKLVMVVIVYLANFKKLMQALSHIMFILNPVTWVEVEHPAPDQWAGGCGARSILRLWSYSHTLWMAPLLAGLMGLLVNYLVCVDSVSIILSAGSARDAIFDGLAIVFIEELSGVWWEFCVQTFALNTSETIFKLRPADGDTWTLDGRIAEARRSQLGCLSIAPCCVWLTTPRCCGALGSFLRVGYGAIRLERGLALLVLFGLYCRQLFVVLHAVDTLVLPAARDLCTEYTLMLDDSALAVVWQAFQKALRVNFDKEIKAKISPQSCIGEDAPLRRMTLDKMLELAVKYQGVLIVFAATLGGLLILPTLFRASQAWQGAQIQPTEDEKRTQDLREELMSLRKELHGCGARAADVLRELEAIEARVEV